MSTDVGWDPGSTTFTKSGSRSLLGFFPLRIQCIKSTQLATEHAQLSNCQPYPTCGVSLSRSSTPGPFLFLFSLPEALFLVFISWPALTSDLSLNVTSSRKPSETRLADLLVP